MLSLENILTILFVICIILYGMPIMQFVTFLYYKFKHTEYERVSRESLDEGTIDTLKPLEDFLLSKGFEYKDMLQYESNIVGNNQKQYSAYYYNKQSNVHAFISTQSYRGALEPVAITYKTVYENGESVETVNGLKHFIQISPDSVSLCDHYLLDNEAIYLAHLNDRKEKTLSINGVSYTQDTIVETRQKNEMFYIKSWEEAGLVKVDEIGYRFRFSWATWKFSIAATKGYKRFSKYLKNHVSEDTEHDKKSQHRALLMQLKEMEKRRGDSNKILWFGISVIAFVVLFGLLGLSLADIIILVLVLFIHELGHLLAMRYFGYTDTSIFFLPFGAAAVGKKEHRKAYEEYIVSLAGPLPGMIIGGGILLWSLIYNHTINTDSYLQTYAIMSLVLNYINLLPIYPLDGGRILQTLMLLRFPRGQFYFYVISLGMLITAMFWLQDPILLIFVVIVGLGLKPSYRISQFLKHVLDTYKQDTIDNSAVAKLIIEDEKYTKETLATKANIAKQTLHIMRTSKPSKWLLTFGMMIYLLLLLPPFAIVYGGYMGKNNSEYSKLPKNAQEELDTFYKKKSSYEGLTQSPVENYNLEDSMHILDTYMYDKDLNRTIGTALKVSSSDINLSDIPKTLVKLFKWHNGITNFIPDEDFYSLAKMRSNYHEIKEDELKYDDNFTTDYRIIISEYGHHGLAYHLKKEGIYRYSTYNYEEENTKVFYSFNHMLKVTAEAYKAGIYYYDYDGLYVNEAGFSNLNKRYLSSADKRRYASLVSYLQLKSKAYLGSPYPYIQKELLRALANTYDSSMIPFIKEYLTDDNKKVRQQAVHSLGILGDTSMIPLLLTQLEDNPLHCKGCALSGLSYLVNKNNDEILDTIHQSSIDKKMWIRRNAYRVIAKIANENSFALLKSVFKDENSACKLVIAEAFGRIGNVDALPLLKEYLDEINKMDFSVSYKNRHRNKNPHPKTLKYEVEKAINVLEDKRDK